MFWMRSTRRVSKREEKALSLCMLFVLIPHYKPCEKSLLYSFVKKLPTGPLLKKLHSLAGDDSSHSTSAAAAQCLTPCFSSDNVPSFFMVATNSW